MRQPRVALASIVLLLAGTLLAARQSGGAVEGWPAPALDSGIAIGTRLPRPAAGPLLLFFWAHWCAECKSESQALSAIAEKYRSRGLVIVAPTRRYGYADGGRPAPPDRELRHIVRVRDTYYPFLRQAPVPVSAANYQSFGVEVVPMHVLIDGQGIVRLVQEGVMTEAALDAAVARLLAR